MYFVDSGASASCVSYDMLDNEERRAIHKPADMPHHVLTVNGNDIEVFGKVTCTVQFGDQLHQHSFLVTALPRPLLGWDFMKAHHAPRSCPYTKCWTNQHTAPLAAREPSNESLLCHAWMG